MRTKPMLGLGAVALALGGLAVGAPAASAAGSGWTATPLEVPADVFGVRVNATDGVDQLVGSYDAFDEGGQARPGVIWHGTASTVLGEAFDDLTDLNAINSHGVAVGSHAAIGEQAQAVEWTGDHYVDLPGPAGAETIATGINEGGDVVGTANDQVVLWPASDPGTYRLLTMPYPTYASGVSVADDGTVAASVLEPVGSGPLHAFRWDSAGQPHELDRVQPNYEHNVATIVHDQVAGSAGNLGAIVWGTDGTVQRFLEDIQFYGINADGDLLARGPEAGPWFVDEDGVRTDLPADFLPSGPTTLLTDGSVAGYTYDDATGTQTAVLWQRT